MADSADTFSDVILLKNCCNVRMSDFLSKHEIRKIDDQIHVLTLRNEDDIWCAQLWEHGGIADWIVAAVCNV